MNSAQQSSVGQLKTFFGYDGSNLNLQDLTFDVNPGQTVAIVGQTGPAKPASSVSSTALTILHVASKSTVSTCEWKLDSLRDRYRSSSRHLLF